MSTPTLKELIIIHINYRDVFNAAVHLSELQRWISLVEVSQLKSALDELVAEGLLDVDSQMNYCVAGRSEIILFSARKKRLSGKCLKKHEKIVKYLSWMPFVRFIGISGSIAAENATIDRVGIHKNSVDLDIFIITASNSLWLVFYFVRLITAIFTFFIGQKYVFCFNYGMDSSFLAIHNKNIYTATELFNLKPMYNKGNTYQLLITSNSWAGKYYPSLNFRQPQNKKSFLDSVDKLGSFVRYPFNRCTFYLFHLTRAVKNLSITPLFEMKSEFNPAFRGNLKRFSSPNGGYENLIIEQFEKKLKNNFGRYYRVDLMEYLFPEKRKGLTINLALDEFAQSFTKYSISQHG